MDERPAPQTNPPQQIVRKEGTLHTVFVILIKDVFSGTRGIASGFGTVVSTSIKLTKEKIAIIPNIPSNPSHSPRNGAAMNAIPKAVPMLTPIAALARVLTSGRVKSATRANTVELIAPVP